MSFIIEGEIFGGAFHIEQKLGEGGMAWVYRAIHTQDGREVAIKILFPHLANDPKVRQRFLSEAQIQSQLEHPHIANVSDIHEDAELTGFAMEWCNAGDLRSWMREEGRAPSIEQWRRLFLPIVDAMAHAHDQGVVHRDLKPSNILLTYDQDILSPRVSDFGIAKILGVTSRTRTGSLMGTLSYMSPEQLEDSKKVDLRADLYSLGVLMYQLSTGRLPFQDKGPSVVLQIFRDPPLPPKEAPRSLQPVILRCLEKNPNDRYADCRALYKAVEQALDKSSKRTWSRPSYPLHLSSPESLATPDGEDSAEVLAAALSETLPPDSFVEAPPPRIHSLEQSLVIPAPNAGFDDKATEESPIPNLIGPSAKTMKNPPFMPDPRIFEKAHESFHKKMSIDREVPEISRLRREHPQLATGEEAKAGRGWALALLFALLVGAGSVFAMWDRMPWSRSAPSPPAARHSGEKPAFVDAGIQARTRRPQSRRLRAGVPIHNLTPPTTPTPASQRPAVADAGPPGKPAVPDSSVPTERRVAPEARALVPEAKKAPAEGKAQVIPEAKAARPVAEKKAATPDARAAATPDVKAAAAPDVKAAATPDVRAPASPDARAVVGRRSPAIPDGRSPVSRPPRPAPARIPDARAIPRVPDRRGSPPEGRSALVAIPEGRPAPGPRRPGATGAAPGPATRTKTSQRVVPRARSVRPAPPRRLTSRGGGPPAPVRRPPVRPAPRPRWVCPETDALQCGRLKKCRSGEGKACFDYAYKRYRKNKSDPKARQQFRRACALRFGRGCNAIGVIHYLGQGVAKNRRAALKWYQLGCGLKSPRSCTHLGVLYSSQRPRKYAKANQLYRKACALKYGRACFKLGNHIARGRGASRSLPKANGLFRLGCKYGDAKACTYLGYNVFYGKGTTRNLRFANQLFFKGCRGNNARACWWVGFHYYKGRGLPLHYRKAHRYFGRACKGGYGWGCKHLGQMFELGHGKTPNTRRANYYYRRANGIFRKGCGKGYAITCFWLGRMYAEGRGVRPSCPRANRLYRRACKLGFRKACHRECVHHFHNAPPSHHQPSFPPFE